MNMLIEAKDITKYFNTRQGKLHAVDGINFGIKKGKTLGLVGESGCGKSTLGRVVLGLLKPTGGKILFEGQDVTEIKGKGKMGKACKMQMIFQDPYASLNPRMNVLQLISEPLVMNRVCKNKRQILEKVLGLMETVGLAENFIGKYPHEMDGGRRQRVGVARSLALDPKFIVCDEPVSALDVSIQAQILNLLMDIQEAKEITYLFISHDLSVVKHISEEIMVLYMGKCIELAGAEELFQNPLHPYTQALISAIPEPRLSKEKKQQLIKGEVTSPIEPEPGCRFAPRCKYCSKKCIGQDINLKDLGNGHFVACTLY